MAHYIIPEIISNGDTSTTSGIVLNADDLLEIQNGGVATDVTFNSGGIIWVYSGGMVDNALVNVGGCMEVKNGASATGIVENGGWVDVQEGATVSFASNTFSGLTLNDNQSATVHTGTTANDITVNPGGYLDIASGGTATAILENGGNVWVHDDAWTNVTFIPNVLSGLVLSQNVTLHSGTTAVQITFSGDYKGDFMICSGGIANETMLEGGRIIVYSGGTANETVVNGNRMTVSSGGLANGTVVNSNGGMEVGGLANGTVVNSNGSMYVFEGGLADGAVVNNRGNMWVSSGGTANNTTVAKGGSMTVSSGGTANNITVSSGGSMWVSSGGVVNGAVLYRNFSVSDGVVVNSATVNSGGSMEVKGGGVADHAAVNVGGSMQVRSGGVADNATVNVGGSMSVDNGGMATGIVENGGWVRLWNRNDANVTFQTNTFSGLTLGDKQSASVHAGTTATETTLEKGARLEVYSGGVADHATVNSGGSMGVSSGGVANETTVNVGGKLSVTRGVAEETHVSSGGVLSVGNGGYAESTSLEYRGQMEVLYGGVARDVTMNRATTIRVTGGTVEGITVIGDMSSTRYIYISDNGLVLNVSKTGDSEIVISDGGKLRNGEEAGGNIHVQSGGTLESANCTGTVYVYGSGLVQDIQVTNLFGGMTIYGGGYARRIQADGTVHVSSGGILEDSDITRTLHVSSGGTAIGIRKNSWDDFNVLEGGLSLEAQIICGPQNVLSGGIASATELAGSGSQIVMSGGSVKETTLNNGGFLIVSRGGVATDVQAVRDGVIQVESGGRLRDVSLKMYNMMIVSEGGKAEDANVASGGVVYLLNGAVLGGHLQLSEGAVMSAYEGSVIDFDLGEANNTTALVNDLSVIAGAPSYTITVPAEIAEGEYLLADGAADFAGTITVKDDTMRYGTLSVENPLVHGWNTYALNLNNGSLSLTVARNDVYHEAEQNEPEPEEIIVSSGAEIPSGETLVWENTGDIVRITSGAVLRDVEIPWGGTLILEEGAILQGTVRLGTDVRANGIVNATDANLELDISKRKEEYGILLDNLAFVTAAALSVIVDPDQNKGEYILAGNAQEFDGVLTVKSTDGMNRGTISEEQETLDYDITRYILTKNEKNELVFIVSSNIPDETDYILLYKNGRLVLAEESEYELTLSGQNEFDQMIVLANGCAEQITLGGGGLLTVKAGGRAAGVRQAEGGSLRFDYAEGDSTVINGFNQGGAFFVGNNVLENVRGENVTVTGNVSVRDYGGSGRFEARDGVSITGALHSEELVLSDVTMEGVSVSTDHASFHSGNRIDHCRLDGRGTINVKSEETYNYWFYGGTKVSNSVFTAPTVLCSGASVSDSVFKSYVSLLGGTLSNVAFDLADYQTARFIVMGHVTCEGDLLFTKQPEYWGGFFDMNGHSAIMDYTGREDRDEAMIRRDAFSEDTVFQLNLNEDQVIGTYAIATGAAQGIIDTYHISVNGSIIGTINGNNREFVNGNYSYAMSSEDGNIFLTVDISDDAEESYSVVWYDADRTIRHSAVASELTIGTDAFPLALVRNNGALNNATLGSGGVLKVKKGGRVAGLRQEEGGSLRFDYAEGDTTVIDGFNQGGAFFVGNNVLENVRGENVTVTGNVSVRDYGGSGRFEARDGVSITGSLNSEELVLSDVTMEGVSVSTYSGEFNSGSMISQCQLDGTGYYNTENYRLNSGSTVSHSVFNTPVIINQDATVSDSAFNSFATLFGGTVSNITFNAGYTLFGSVSLAGDITLNCSGGCLENGDTCFNVNGHTVNVNYRNRTVTDSGMFSVNCFSEDATFRLLFQKDQRIGTYTIAYGAGSLVDSFLMNIDGEDTEYLSYENPEMTFGNYRYTLAHDVETQLITLTIDASEDADETFGVCYDGPEDEFLHSASLDDMEFRQGGYHNLTVRNGGAITNSTLGDTLLTVKAGGRVTGLRQEEGGSLRFDYAEGDSTVINGFNQGGAFFVGNNVLENVRGENVTVTGNVSVRDYGGSGRFEARDGVSITGTLNSEELVLSDVTMEGVSVSTYSGEFNSGSMIDHCQLDGTGFYNMENYRLNSGSTVSHSVFNTPVIINQDATVSDSVFNSVSNSLFTELTDAIFFGGTLSEIVINGGWSVRGFISLDGDLTLRSTGWRFDSGDLGIDTASQASSGVDGNGFTVNLDLTERTEADSELLTLSKLYNTELRVVMDPRQAIGTYTLASHASMIGQNDANGVWDGNTNQWRFRGQTVGDRDRIVQVYDSNGIELANCTVDGDAEYHGRYNYTVYVDDEGYLKLKVGWNNRSGLTYSADEMENNDSLETATEIIGGEKVVPNLTIHSADDVDWFMFELETSGRKSNYIGIDFKQWAGDLDISLYNEDGKLIDYARSVTDNERLSLSGYTAGAYYLKVSGDNGNTNSYKLVYDLPEPVVLADEYEKGNSPLTNTYLGEIAGSKTVRAAIQAANDVDYFSFRLGHRGTGADSITLSFEPEVGDLDLYLFDISGVFMLGKSVSTNGGSETVSLNGLNRGIYVVKVVGKDGTAANYDLTFNVREDEVDPDRYENNDSMRKATKLYTLNSEKTLTGLSIHSDTDVDYYSFSILEKGSADDSITLSYVAQLGDLDIEILNVNGEVVAYSRTAENDDMVSLKGLDIGEYYVRVYGYNNVTNNYTLSWHVTNSALIPSDAYEGYEPILIREDQTISGLSIAKVREDDETRQDTFKIVLKYNAWKRSKIILTDYRSDWEDGMSYVIRDADGNVRTEGIDSEISLYGLEAGEYYLTLDAPNEDEYSEYSLIAQNLPDSDIAKDNTWSIFIYMAGDNNLEGAFLQELLYMQKAILPENVEVYVLMDRSEGYAVGERNWTDTRVGRIRHSNGGAVAVQWMYFDGPETGTYVNANNMDPGREWDTGDIATLEAFLDWGMNVGRADNYALIMCDHGTSLGYNCSDEDSDSMMAIKDIAELLKADKYKDLSVAAFEQCLMGSDVVVTAMEGSVDYVVASEAVGWMPNFLVMYNVLLNSFETDMTSQGLSRKIVAACNCSGLQDLTMASFKSDGNTLGEALEQFGDLAKDFTFADWVALCKCFSKVHNYGDEICAYSDLGSILNMIKGYHETISSTLLDAANDLYDTVMNIVIDSAQITPDIYGSGLAVFNPVLSDPMMAAYAYGGKSLDYYATDIGKTSWGKFMYTLSKMADDCSDYIVDASGNLSFTSFTYYFDDGEIRNSYDLGAFSGNGVSFEGLYMDHSAYFNVTLEQAGIEGDAILVTADNPNAKVTISLYSDSGIRRVFENGVLPLDGIDFEKNRTDNDYTLVITTTEETTYDLRFAGNWTTGVDFFDYSRTGSISPLAAGNNSIDKATELPNGNYGGLVTSAGDRDYYKILSVYANTIDVTVTGSGLVVQEFNAEGELLQTAAEENGQYKLAVAKENYVCVEGTADIFSGECNSYKLSISDAARMYLKAELNAVLPEKPAVEGELKDNQVVVSVNVEDGMKGYSSDDLQTWTECENDSFVATQNGQYYFKSVNPETKLESMYTSLRIVGIDNVLPTVSNVKADVITPTNVNVIVTAEFADDVQLDAAQYRIDEGGEWLDYVDGVTVSENATVYFRAIDVAGNTSAIVPYDVTNIDKALPTVSDIQADITDPTKGSVTVTAVFADNVELKHSLYKIGEGGIWSDYVDCVIVTDNTTVYFKAVDTAGNEAEEAYAVGNIDRDTPVIVVSGDNTTPLKASSLTVTTEAGLDILYSTDGESWTKYEGEITVTANGTYYFMATDAAGNTGRAEYEFRNIDTTAPEITLSGDNQTPLQASTLIASVDDGSAIFYRIGDSDWQEYTGAITVIANGTYHFSAKDAAGNEGTDSIVFANIIQAPVSEVAPQTQTWEKVAETTKYIVELSTDDGHAIQLVVDSNSLDSFQMPAGNYQMRVKPEGGEWSEPEPVEAKKTATEPKLVKSNADGNADVFFANPIGTWESGYVAQHVGSINDWSGTNEYASVCGKNRLADIIEGSTDANILLMTDGDSGDSLFVDDIYTTLPGSVTEQQSRIAQIDEIRAGAGDDIVDMTSQRFEYVGDGLTIRGGVGNDVIWASKGDNFLFGDAGNDRIAGASGNDVIAGGIGYDRMHGGGGSDIFTFGGSNWGEDTVEQLATGSVTLWFASGSMDNWDSASLTYRDGDNCVKVIGTTSIELRFGNDDSDMYKDLVSAGAFEEFTSERIFEESGKGSLASLQ